MATVMIKAIFTLSHLIELAVFFNDMQGLLEVCHLSFIDILLCDPHKIMIAALLLGSFVRNDG